MPTMNLRDFVKNSLTDVLNGIKDAQRDPDTGSHVVQARAGSLGGPAAILRVLRDSA